ncbi:MAG: NUDIX hydrolase [Acidimicrobiales bacterium]
MNRHLDASYHEWVTEQHRAGSPVTTAATVVILRDHAGELEVLMLRRGAEAAFAGGLWVFPGGKVDPDDHGEGEVDLLSAARTAAVRESAEEASQTIDVDSLVWFAHWAPPQGAKFRFATFFFACRALHEDVEIDPYEISDHAWLRPSDALARHRAKEVQLAPPTFVTLTYLSRAASVADALDAYGAHEPRFYETQVIRTDASMTFLWHPDAGYGTKDLDVDGPRHRVITGEQGWHLDDSGLPW